MCKERIKDQLTETRGEDNCSSSRSWLRFPLGIGSRNEATLSLVHSVRILEPGGRCRRVVAAEILEHIPDDTRAMAELVRVLRPGGTLAVSVPRWLPEVINWRLSDDYHNTPGGHIRIYTDHELRWKVVNAGMEYAGKSYAHGLHSPYWWLKCVVGVDNADHPLVKAYHQVLVWDIMKRPHYSAATRLAEKALNPLIGKSMVLYFRKPE